MLSKKSKSPRKSILPSFASSSPRRNWANGKQNTTLSFSVDYALEMQRIAWRDGYLMSIETLIDKGGNTGHMINSTVIGDDIIFLEPQSTTNWVGGVRGNVGVVYRPILVYPKTGEVVFRVE